MTKAVLEEFGITKEDVLERVVEKISDQMLNERFSDEYGSETGSEPTRFQELCKTAVMAKVNEAVDKIAAKNVLPNVETYLENLVLKSTNKWGEQTAAPQTFLEYLTKRCEGYMVEEVDSSGKTQAQETYNWRKAGTRISCMMEKHLQYHISSAVEKALKDLNSKVAVGIAETVKIQLADALAKLKVGVSL